ncbi:MAG: type II toxin-antitoxin system HicA family toxin [Novosphingobium sp.]
MVDKFGRELKRILRANGCVFVRHGKGDQEIWHSPITDRNFTVEPRPASGSPPTPFSNRQGSSQTGRDQAGVLIA